jgi:hypothetical protein
MFVTVIATALAAQLVASRAPEAPCVAALDGISYAMREGSTISMAIRLSGAGLTSKDWDDVQHPLAQEFRDLVQRARQNVDVLRDRLKTVQEICPPQVYENTAMQVNTAVATRQQSLKILERLPIISGVPKWTSPK